MRRAATPDDPFTLALKRWKEVAQENRAAMVRHTFFVGPAEARRRKARNARSRARKKAAPRH